MGAQALKVQHLMRPEAQWKQRDVQYPVMLPSCTRKRLHHYGKIMKDPPFSMGKSAFSMGKSTIAMAILNSYSDITRGYLFSTPVSPAVKQTG